MTSGHNNPVGDGQLFGATSLLAPKWTAWLKELIRERSVRGAESGVTRWAENQVKKLGLRSERIEFDVEKLEALPGVQQPISPNLGRFNIVGVRPGRQGQRSLILNAHLDVVPEGDPADWTSPPFTPRIDPGSNLIFGRGAMDDKAGVVIALGVIDLLNHFGIELQGSLQVQLVLEDETTGNGSLLCLTNGPKADAAFIIDGTRANRAISQHAGNVQFGLQLRGKPASVSVSHMGINAIETLAELILHLRKTVFDLNAARRDPWTRFPSPFQLVTQSISGDAAEMCVPDKAEVRCFVTFPPPFTLATIRQLLEQEAECFLKERGLPKQPLFDWSGFAVEPVESDANEIGSLLNNCAKSLGMEPIDIGPSTGTSDMRHFVNAGIPCLLYGPGNGNNPHRPDEHYCLDDLSRMITLYFHIVCEWCGIEQ